MAIKTNNKSLCFWLLALAIGFRTLIVPGLTPIYDEDSPLGFNITFCEDLFENQPTSDSSHGHDGHTHSHGNTDNDDDNSDIIPLSNHCSVAFMGGIFIEAPTFDIAKYVDRTNDILTADYFVPYIVTPRYQHQLSRAPPTSSSI